MAEVELSIHHWGKEHQVTSESDTKLITPEDQPDEQTSRDEPQAEAVDETGSGALATGTLLQERYEILKILGVGGMGAVYQARDLRFSQTTRLCAVKEIVSIIPDPEARKNSLANFEREANVLAELSHPAIPKVYDFFSEEPRNYLILEFIEGRDLETVLQTTPSFLDEGEVLGWSIQICDVLAYLHSWEPDPIMFRDVKPSNIMLRNDGRIILIDFGIARVFQAGTKGTMVGTQGYSPPEQYKGMAEPRGDLYALGATIHHLLTKKDPRLEAPFTFNERLPRALNPAVGEDTEKVVMKALEYDVDDRFTSALEMKEALEEALPETPHAPKDGMSLPILETKEGHSIQPLWQFACEDEVRSSPTIADGSLFVGCYDNNLYCLDASNGDFRWKYPTEGGICATPCVSQGMVVVGSEDGVMYALETQNGRIVWTCPTHGKIRSSARIAYDAVFFGSDDSALYAVNARSGVLVWKHETARFVRSSPCVHEELLYFGSDDGHVYCLDAFTGEIRWRYRTSAAVTSSPTVSEDLVYVGSWDGTVYSLDCNSGWAVWRFRTNQPVLSSPSVAGGRIYVGCMDHHLYCLDAKSGKLLWKFATQGQVNSSPTLQDDLVYFGSVDGRLYALEAESGELRWEFQAAGPIPASPIATDGVVYISSMDKNVYALPAGSELGDD
jgi:outer membrane protein assembly factor BamB